jgi:hypothetical protein
VDLHPLTASSLTFGKPGLTLGHVVAMQGTEVNARETYEHELAHVKQHDWMGPAYLPAHMVTKAWCYAFSPFPTECDPLERGPNKNPPCAF